MEPDLDEDLDGLLKRLFGEGGLPALLELFAARSASLWNLASFRFLDNFSFRLDSRGRRGGNGLLDRAFLPSMGLNPLR